MRINKGTSYSIISISLVQLSFVSNCSVGINFKISFFYMKLYLHFICETDDRYTCTCRCLYLCKLMTYVKIFCLVYSKHKGIVIVPKLLQISFSPANYVYNTCVILSIIVKNETINIKYMQMLFMVFYNRKYICPLIYTALKQ